MQPLAMQLVGHLHLVWELLHVVQNLEMETWVLLLVAMTMTPFIISAGWSMGLCALYQLFVLGLWGSFYLISFSSVYFMLVHWKPTWGLLSMLKSSKSGKDDGKVCTHLDVVLSVIFQLGINIPSPVWDFVMDKSGAGADTKQMVLDEKLQAPEKGSGLPNASSKPVSAVYDFDQEGFSATLPLPLKTKVAFTPENTVHSFQSDSDSATSSASAPAFPCVPPVGPNLRIRNRGGRRRSTRIQV